MKRTLWLMMVLLVVSVCRAQEDGMTEFKKMKYGFFVHYVWAGDYGGLTKDKNGKFPASFDALADGFDVQGFANDLAAWQVEYVIFTAWHANINPLFPSKTMAKWGLKRHVCKRDLLGEILKALKAKGIKVMFYTHPRDGHDLRGEEQIITGWGPGSQPNPDWSKLDRQKWNDFTNELYAELVERYGKDLIGLYSDEGSGAGDSYRVVDYPRLRQTIKSRAPHLVLVQNWYGNLYSLDIGDKEFHFWGEFASNDGNAWATWAQPVGTCFATTWWSGTAAGKNTVRFSAEDMFRFTVMQAGANAEGGGVQWATGPYVGGGWETGVDETMRKVGGYIQRIAESIKQTYPSTSYLTPPGKKIPDLTWGVATKSTDERFEYIHVLRPPTGNTLTLPVPADGKKFTSATLLPGGQPVALKQDDGGVTLTLPAGATWDKLNTVIKLAVAKNSPPVNLAQWKAFRVSSWLDTARHAKNLVDGLEQTAWVSLPEDKQAWGQVDLARPCRISRIEVFGDVAGNVELRVSQTGDFKDSKAVASRPASKQTLVIKKATYGAGERTVDVTEKVRAAGGTVQAENALVGHDPAPNVVKELRVEYTLNGKEQSATVREGESLQLGENKPWVVELPAPVTARFVRVGRAQPGESLSIREIKVYGK